MKVPNMPTNPPSKPEPTTAQCSVKIQFGIALVIFSVLLGAFCDTYSTVPFIIYIIAADFALFLSGMYLLIHNK